MEDKDILNKLQIFEEKILFKFSELDKLLIELKKEHYKLSKQSSNDLFYQKLVIPVFNICLDKNLYERLLNDEDSFLPSRLTDFRSKLLDEKGLVIPPFEINCLETLSPNCYMIFIRNEIVSKNTIDQDLDDPWALIIEDLNEVIFYNADKIITRDMIWNLLTFLQETDETILKELLSKDINIGLIRQVLVNLVKERLSIKDIRLIIQKISEVDQSKFLNVDKLSETLRRSLIYSIVNDYIINDRALNIVMLSEELEHAFISSINKPNNTINTNALGQVIFESILEFNQPEAVLIVSPDIRLEVYRALEEFDPSIIVLATTELSDSLDLNILGTIDLVKCYDIDNLETLDQYEIDYNYLDSIFEDQDKDLNQEEDD